MLPVTETSQGERERERGELGRMQEKRDSQSRAAGSFGKVGVSE